LLNGGKNEVLTQTYPNLLKLTQTYSNLLKLTQYVIVSLFFIIIFGCNENVPTQEKSTTSDELYTKTFNLKKGENSKYDAVEVTNALEEVSMALARTLKNK
jgi:hypothetical protein